MSLVGLQPGPDTSATCGDTLCSFGDWFSMSQGCAGYLVCADPSFVSTVTTLAANPGALQPLIVAPIATAPLVGQATGQLLNVATTAAVDTATGAGGAFFQNASASTLIWIAVAAITAAFVLPKVMGK